MSFLATSSEGVRRLSLFVGSICALLSLWRSAWITDFFTVFDDPLWDMVAATGLTALCFVVPYALIRGVAWVIFGFTRK